MQDGCILPEKCCKQKHISIMQHHVSIEKAVLQRCLSASIGFALSSSVIQHFDVFKNARIGGTLLNWLYDMDF